MGSGLGFILPEHPLPRSIVKRELGSIFTEVISSRVICVAIDSVPLVLVVVVVLACPP
jgi:hypothetical protein